MFTSLISLIISPYTPVHSNYSKYYTKGSSLWLGLVYQETFYLWLACYDFFYSTLLNCSELHWRKVSVSAAVRKETTSGNVRGAEDQNKTARIVINTSVGQTCTNTRNTGIPSEVLSSWICQQMQTDGRHIFAVVLAISNTAPSSVSDRQGLISSTYIWDYCHE